MLFTICTIQKSTILHGFQQTGVANEVMFVCAVCMHADSADLCLVSSATHTTEYRESVIMAPLELFLLILIFVGSNFRSIFVFCEICDN